MNEFIEKLLQPVSAEQVCGPDLSNDVQFDELETILKGKPEVEIGNIQKPAEPPDWKELKDRSSEFLARSKHLRVATMYCCSLLKTSGMTGFRDGVQLIQGLLEKYWAPLYPLLDPEDNNDPTQRLNILGALTVPRGSSAAGWLTIVDGLYAAAVCQPKGAPPLTFDNLIASRQAATEGAPAGGPSTAAVASALRDVGSEQLSAQRDAVQQALEGVRAIDQFLTSTLGAGNTISFEVAEKVLQEMLAGLQAYMDGAAGGDVAAAEATTGGVSGGGADSAAITVRGAIRSREDVVRAIDNICSYYEQVEPCSPVPYLLRRAQKLAGMNFIEAVQELNLATTDSLRPSMGSAVPADAPPAA
jgi:type VI secretion system protein ImpA